MIWTFFIRWVMSWVSTILIPMLQDLYFYKLVGVWLAAMWVTTYGFFYLLDKDRLPHVKIKLFKTIIKSCLIGLAASTLLIGLLGLATTIVGQSDFFIHKRSTILAVSMFTMPSFVGFGHLYQDITILFLLLSGYCLIEFVAEMSYQLEDDKTWWYYLCNVSLVSFMIYVLFLLI